jgi:hypothetical protein
MMPDCQQAWNFQKLTFFLRLFDFIGELTLDASPVDVLLKTQKLNAELKVESLACPDPPNRFPSSSSFGASDRGVDAA